jgi:hypothetical protein
MKKQVWSPERYGTEFFAICNGKTQNLWTSFSFFKDLIEVWDEAKRLRCEWYNDYEKGVTKPPIRVSDLEVVELNFRGIFSFLKCNLLNSWILWFNKNPQEGNFDCSLKSPSAWNVNWIEFHFAVMEDTCKISLNKTSDKIVCLPFHQPFMTKLSFES